MAELNMDELRLWLFDEAPEEFQKLSDNGGDEDWLLFVPERLENDPLVLRLAEKLDVSATPEEFEIEGGWVFIGSHA